MTDLRNDLRLILDAAIREWARDTRSQELREALVRWEMIYEAVQSKAFTVGQSGSGDIRPGRH